MEGGVEQILPSSEVVVSIMGIQEASREDILCATMDSDEFPKGKPVVAPHLRNLPMGTESGKFVHYSSLDTNSPPNIMSPTSKTSSGSLYNTEEVTKYSDDDGENEGENNDYNEGGNDKIAKRKNIFRLLEFTVFLGLLVICITSLTARRIRQHKIWSSETWRWCLMGFVTLCGRLLAEWFVNVLVFSIERKYLLKRKIIYLVYGMRKSFQAIIWSALVLLVWVFLITRDVKRSADTTKIFKHITRGLISFLIGTILWIVKTLLLKKVAISYHTTNFFEHIENSLNDQHVLNTLLGSSLLESLPSLDNIKEIGNGVEEHKPSMRQIRNVLDAKRAARRVFRNVAKPGHKYIDEEDLRRFTTTDDVHEWMGRLGSVAETGKIKKSALRNWLVNAYKNRQFLEYALKDTKANIKELNNIISGILFVVIIVISLLVMEIATTELVILLSSQIAVLAFIFGNACKDLFECVIFVFERRLFSVGDCCVIDGVQMTVDQMSLSKTVFLKNEKESIVFPNSILITKPITNFYRTPPTNYSVEFVISLPTPDQKIEALKAKVKEYIERKDDHWRLEHSIQYKEIIESNKLKMALKVSHSVYFLDDEEKSGQRSSLIFQLKKILEELDIV